MKKETIIQNSVSNEKKYCEGFFSSQNNDSYFLGINLSVAKVKKKYSQDNLSMLDKICAFDKAEVATMNLGQINMIEVSSFCGPKGLIWGHDICPISFHQSKIIKIVNDFQGNSINIFSLRTIEEALGGLLGSVLEPRFPFLPGAHIPCAVKKIISDEEGTIFAALGIGVPFNREHHACLLMENIGSFSNKNIYFEKEVILDSLIDSILQVGKNQMVRYEKIFIGMKAIKINKGEVGCALVAAPYFTIAQDALPLKAFHFNFSFEEWEKEIKNDFLFRSRALEK